MSDKIVTLKTASKPIETVDPEVVSRLERLLDLAKAGGVQGVIFATLESDGAGSVISAGSGYAGEAVYQNVHAALGALVSAQHRFIRERIE